MWTDVDECGLSDENGREWRIDDDGRKLMLMDVIGCGFLREDFDGCG